MINELMCLSLTVRHLGHSCDHDFGKPAGILPTTYLRVQTGLVTLLQHSFSLLVVKNHLLTLQAT